MSSSRLAKTIEYLLYAGLFVPLVFTPFTVFPWHFGKTILFQATVEIALLLTIVLAAQDALWCQRLLLRVKKITALDYALLIFLIILVVTSFTGIDVGHSWWPNQSRANGVFTWLHFGAWYAMVTVFITTRSQWAKFIDTALVVALIVSATAIFQTWLPMSWRGNLGSRMSGIIGNSAFLALYLIPTLGLMAVRLIQAGRGLGAWRLWGLAVIAGTLFFTGSRGALLGVGSGIVAASCALPIIFKKRTPGLKRSLYVLGGVAAVIIALVVFSRVPGVTRRFPQLGFFNDFSLSAATAHTRLMAWGVAWQGIKDKPVTGWGWANFEAAFDYHYNPQFLRHSFQETVWDKPHNFLLEVGVAAGFMGMIAYAGIFLTSGYYLLRSKNIDNPESGLSPAVLAAVLATLGAYGVALLFLFETSNSMVLFFAILAYITAQVVGVDEVASSARGTVRKNIVWSGAVVIVGLSVALSLWKWHFLALAASNHLRRADASTDIGVIAQEGHLALTIPSTLTAENAMLLARKIVELDKQNVAMNSAILEDIGVETAQKLEEAHRRQPQFLPYPLWGGQAYLVLGSQVKEGYFKDAERLLLGAEKISPRKQEVLLLITRLYLLQKKFSAAIAYAERAVEASPDIHTAYWFLGLARVSSGDLSKGLVDIEGAIDRGFSLTRDQELYIIDLYAEAKKYAKVVEWYVRLSEKEPDNVNWLIKLATAYAMAGNKAKALETVKHAMALYPPLETDAKAFIKKYKLE